MHLNSLIKDINIIDTRDICSDWKWLLDNHEEVILVSAIGDMFLLGKDKAIYWLDVGMGELTCVAESIDEFQNLLREEEKINIWLLPQLVSKLVSAGKVLGKNQVYSFKRPPALGGDYSIGNFDTTDISVHFSIFGQIHKQIWDLPDGTKINSVNIK